MLDIPAAEERRYAPQRARLLRIMQHSHYHPNSILVVEVVSLESLEGTIGIVTGAGGGLGGAIARRLASQGVRIVAASLPQEAEALTALVSKIKSEGGEAEWHPVDVRKPEQCAELVKWTVERMGGLDILVNNAGLGYWASVEETTDAQWLQTMDVNVNGVFFMSRNALDPMKKQRRGHIVNIASVLGRRGAPNMAAYCASKAAVMAFSESLLKEVKDYGIQVSVISPGTADTGFRATHTNRPQDRSLTDPELMLRPEDVADAVVWAIKTSHHVSSAQVALEPYG